MVELRLHTPTYSALVDSELHADSSYTIQAPYVEMICLAIVNLIVEVEKATYFL